MFDFDKLNDDWSKFYYTTLMMFFVELIALVVAIIYGRNTKIGRVFIFYIFFDFCILIADNMIGAASGISKKRYSSFITYSNTLISLIEMLVYYYYFSKVLPGRRIKILMKTLASFYTITIIVFFVTRFDFMTLRFSYVSYILGAVEFIFLLPPCLFYFYTILNNNSEISLLKRPSFWIVTGIFFFSLISIPYYVLNKYIIINDNDIWFPICAALYYIPFTMNFAFLIKSFLCKRTLTI